MNNDPLPDVGSSINSSASETHARNPTPADSLSVSIAGLAEAHGFPLFWVGTFPAADTPGLRDNRVADNWPDSLIRAYDASAMFYPSELVSALRETTTPQFRDISAFDVGRRGVVRSLSLEFKRHGFRQTLAVSAHDAQGRRFLAIFSGKGGPTANLAAIQYDVNRFIDAYSRALGERAPDARMLGRREAECLRWVAAGKSSEEIAIILKISPHTVNYYLGSAMRKLGCVNRMHAIARALQLKLI